MRAPWTASARTGLLRTVVRALLFGLLPCGALRAATLPADSLAHGIARDSLIHDSTAAHRRFVPLHALGSWDAPLLVTPRVLVENVINQTFDAVALDAHVYPRTLGTPGQDDELLIDGMDTRNIAVALAGRPMNDPATSRFTFMHIAPEFAQDVEIVRGPRAAVMGFSATTAAINFVPRLLNSNQPFVSVRYDQTSFEHLSSDLVFSQNIARGVNVNVGIDRQSQIGEFRNNGLQYWNVRGAVRWFADTTMNVLLSENFTHNHAGVNGGLWQSDLNVSNVLARANLSQATAEDFRHDVTLTGIYRSAGDTAMQTHASLFFSTLRREYGAQPDLFGYPMTFPFTEASQANTSQWFGVDARQDIAIDQLHLRIGATAMNARTDSSVNLPATSELHAGAYAIAEQRIGGMFTLAAFGRADEISRTFRPTAGADVSAAIIDGLTLVAGAVRTERVPSLQELSWTGPAFRGLLLYPIVPAVTPRNEIHTVVSGGAHFTSTPLDLAVDVSARQIDNIIEPLSKDSLLYLVQTERRRVLAVTSALALRVGAFSLSGTAQMTTEQERGGQLRRIPVLYARGGIYYHTQRFFGVPLEVRAGLEGMAISGYDGETYLPGEQLFVPGPTGFTGMDGTVGWILMVHLGDAYIRMAMPNMLDRRVYFTPFYPIGGRQFHLGVTWALFG